MANCILNICHNPERSRLDSQITVGDKICSFLLTKNLTEIPGNFADKLDCLLFSVSNIPGYWFAEYGCIFLSTVDWLRAENVMKELTCKSCSFCRQVTHSGQCAL